MLTLQKQNTIQNLASARENGTFSATCGLAQDVVSEHCTYFATNHSNIRDILTPAFPTQCPSRSLHLELLTLDPGIRSTMLVSHPAQRAMTQHCDRGIPLRDRVRNKRDCLCCCPFRRVLGFDAAQSLCHSSGSLGFFDVVP